MTPRERAWRSLESEYAALAGVQDPQEVFRRATAAVPRLTGLPVSSFGSLVDQERMVLAHTVNAKAFEGMTVPSGAGLGGTVLTSRRPAWVADYPTCREITADFQDRVAHEAVHGMVVVPVMAGERLLGCLYAASRQRTALGDRVAQVLERIAHETATAAVAAERTRTAVQTAVAEERRRLALELHDSVGAALFTLGAGIRDLRHGTMSRATLAARLKVLADVAAEASWALRGSLSALDASPEELALSVALQRDCREFQTRTGVRATLVVLCDAPALAPATTDALVRAVREGLVNVEKHARASMVAVSIFTARGRLVIAVSDDGVGPPDAPTPGLGLAGAAERLSRVGGDLRLAAGDDGGATLHAWVPLPGPAPQR